MQNGNRSLLDWNVPADKAFDWRRKVKANLDSLKVQSGKLTRQNPSNQMLSRVLSIDAEGCHLEFCSAHVQ